MKLLVLLLLTSLWAVGLKSYKILGIFPHRSRSHFNAFEPLLRALAAKGHELTVISHFPQTNPLPHYTDINLNDTKGSWYHTINMENLSSKRQNKFLFFLVLAEAAKRSCEEGLSNAGVRRLINSKPHFDLIIAEFFNTRCFLGLVHVIGAPLIGISSSTLMAWHDSALGIPSNPAYIPINLMNFSDRMTFIERVQNSIAHVYNHVAFTLLIEGNDNVIARKYFGDAMPSVGDIAGKTSIVLVNSHFSISTPRPAVPGYVEVAGMHLEGPKKLAPNIEQWINESTHGVIYFSLGTRIQGDTFPEDKRQMFLRALGRLPQRVLWKWESEAMPGKPDNVMIQSWMPQFDILCHPNVKAFISHAGLLGTIEAAHCGVPMVMMPQFGDQFTNAEAMEAAEGGLILDLKTLDEETIFNSLIAVLDPSFNKKAKELSKRFRDRPLPPMETAIYWVEYVARHQGANHLRTAAVGMPFYQYYLLDVVAFLLTLFVLGLSIFFVIIRAVRRWFSEMRACRKRKRN